MQLDPLWWDIGLGEDTNFGSLILPMYFVDFADVVLVVSFHCFAKTTVSSPGIKRMQESRDHSCPADKCLVYVGNSYILELLGFGR